METITSSQAMRVRVREWRARGERVGFVPTMGNLHAGHGDLVTRARKIATRVIVSIFVNPMQFGPNEDFAQYPRTPLEDADLLATLGADALFIPDAGDIYPQGYEHATFVEVPEISNILCGEFRPGHFRGVATVVVKLFNIVAPDVAVFGEKDFQQLSVIRHAVKDLCLPIEIVGAPTVRELDGLAMSSRNRYLTAQDRAAAPAIYQSLTAAAQQIKNGERNYAALESQGGTTLVNAGFKLDYFTVRDAATLLSPDDATRHFVVLTAARIGKARLIDNIQVQL
jgi:pantoate--beta-alanine ligase